MKLPWWGILGIVVGGTIIIDQGIKLLFLEGFRWESTCLSLILTRNKGIAFSLFHQWSFLLKLILPVLIGVFVYFFHKEGFLKRYPISTGLLLGGGISNLLDRYLRGEVIDYVYWHCGFNFAIFNLADVCIDLGVGLLLLQLLYRSWRLKKLKK